MKDLKVSITGASGFIGQRLMLALNQQNHSITVLSRKEDRGFPVGVRVIKGDLRSNDCALDQFLNGCDVLFHCAGEVREPKIMREVHVGGTQRLIQALNKKANEKKKPIHWVQLSSVGVYGPPQNSANEKRVITENSLTYPKGEYEVTKLESDDLVIRAANSGLITYSIIRPSIVIAVDMPNSSVRSLVDVIKNKQYFNIGFFSSIATYIHVQDVIDLLVRCGDETRAKNQVFNISNDCALEEIIRAIAMKCEVNYPRVRLPESLVKLMVILMSNLKEPPLTGGRVNALVARTSYPVTKLKTGLGFTPRFSITDVVAQIAATRSMT